MFITMAYIRAKREGEWLLHLAAIRQMIPYFFAAGHFNYARYGSYYLRSMSKLPQHVLDHFLKVNRSCIICAGCGTGSGATNSQRVLS